MKRFWTKIYFIGIGGIGMSALARYFKALNCSVYGYDRTGTALTQKLCEEGILVHYRDDINAIPPSFRNSPDDTLVVYTPAVPASHAELNWFKTHRYRLMKRSETLGMISKDRKTVAVAGTHGKTSVSTMTAFLLIETGVGCDAFLGGISKNYHTNLLLREGSEYLVAEADEYDRSFLHLHPWVAVVTAMDADHLDIYGTHAEVKAAFRQFVAQIQPGGVLLAKYGLELCAPKGVRQYSYSLNNPQADYYAEAVHVNGGCYVANIRTPQGVLKNVQIGVPGLVNVENSIAAIAAALQAGVEPEKAVMATARFEGVQRRFDYRVKNDKCIYIDDYAHHPEELRFTIKSVRELYPGRHITGVFQPHLYTRTRDFADGFAESLSLLDSLILLDIYPAREEPLPGVSSQMIFDKVTVSDKRMCRKEELINILKTSRPDVLLTMGAGDIDTLVKPLENLLKN
ncbi:MAG: UDP-N-acetylmuramate--L-alanine ligase [Bacteroidales bacterium]|jgi:UDP-N-acetylmuramate--alanine ligase|nr:UDP-N-acetylmuramate--L-alanine ligase [Bacteroidales bacterium]